MKKNIIYYADGCPFCQQACQLLTEKGIDFEKIFVDDSAHIWDEIIKKTGRNTVPQIFINDIHIGGFDDLLAADQSGKLAQILSG